MFTNYYGRLQIILPVKSLSGHLVSERIINFEEEQTIQQTVGKTKVVASMILRKILKSLQDDQTNSFDKLLIIMKNYGGLSCEELVDQMSKELAEYANGMVHKV